jgi:hypothetical protein
MDLVAHKQVKSCSGSIYQRHHPEPAVRTSCRVGHLIHDRITNAKNLAQQRNDGLEVPDAPGQSVNVEVHSVKNTFYI